MHLSSLQRMEYFRDRYLSDLAEKPLKILDIGSTEMGACYRPIFTNDAWEYIGVDLAPGANVDLVLKEPYMWSEVADASCDVVVSGQVLEHVEFFWITILEMTRVLKPGGLICLIVPSSGPEHRYPVDCYRFYPDAMRALARFAHLIPLEANTHWDDMGDPGSDIWHDTVGVFRKPVRSFWRGKILSLLQAAQRWVLTVGLPQQ